MTSQTSSAPQSPNIIFIHAESMDGRKMGCMGEPSMQRATPNLDGLAADGVLFRNAYSNCPVSNPSRASMWTGKYPHYYECWNNHEGIGEDVPTFRTLLDRAGYFTRAIGPLDYTWGKHSIRDRIGSWTRAAEVLRPICRTPMPVVTDGDQPHGGDWRLAYEGISFIQEAARSKRPFMLYLTTGLVHPAFVAHRKYMDRIDAGKIEMPPNLRDVDETDHPAMRYMRITKNCDKQFAEPLVHEIRHVYFAMIAALDDLVGRVLDAVDRLGLSGSTYIIFSSDHGEMAGEQNQVLKRSMFESSVHEPLIVRGPDVRRGAEVDTPVSLVDIYPTLVDMARADYGRYADSEAWPQTLDGESLMPQLTGETPRERDWAFSEYNGDRCCTGTYMLRRGDWKYVKYVGFEPQLFNLAEDPWEENDVAADRPEVVRELDAILTERFDCERIDAKAKAYDKRSFLEWREQQTPESYAATMTNVYSGFDRQCIENLMPWRPEDEALIQAWLEEG